MSRAPRPLIGVTSGASALSRRARADYRIALREAGARTIILAPGDDGAAERCDAIVFTGGYDVHPSLYPRRQPDRSLGDEEIIHRYRMHCDEPRDTLELPLARKVLQQGVPALGICRGFQVMNVAGGGGMVPDIPLCIGDGVRHSPAKGEMLRHEIVCETGSLIAKALGRQQPVANTYHHQGVTDAELAPGMRATARAGDGIIEALEMPGHPFFAAVQFHPERRKDAEVKERFRPLFAALVEAARRSAER